MPNLFAFLLFGLFLTQQIYGNHENEKGKLHIRFPRNHPGHAIVSIGNHYEYDYLADDLPRRRIVRKEKAQIAAVTEQAKNMQGNAAQQEFSVAKTDKIFYEMVTHVGWVMKNYSQENVYFCRKFAYEFVCKLFDGKCPPREEWPKEFVEEDEKQRGNCAFMEPYKSARKTKLKKEINERGCHLKEIELKIIFENGTSEKRAKLLPPIVHIYTGKCDPLNMEKFGEDAFSTEEWATKNSAKHDKAEANISEHPNGHGNGNEFKVRLMVFECPGNHFYFRNLIIRDKTAEWELHKIEEGDLNNIKDKTIIVDLSKEPIPRPRPVPVKKTFSPVGMIGQFF